MSEKRNIISIYSASAVLLWSTVATAFKFTLGHFSYSSLLFYSSFFSLISISCIYYFQNRKIPNFADTSYLLKDIITGLLNPFLYYLILFKAYSLLPAQEAQPLNYTWPVMISIFSIIFLKQKFSLLNAAGVVCAFAGVIIIGTSGNFSSLKFENPLGVFLAVFSSVIWASYWIINLKDHRSPAVKLFHTFFWGTVFSFIYFLIFSEDNFSIQGVSGSVYIGFFEMGVTFFFWMKGLELSLDKTRTATLAYLSPFISLIFIVFLLDEELKISSIIGLVFIVSGILIQNSPKILKRRLL